MKPLAVKCVEIMWAVAGLRAFCFPLTFATDHLIHLACSYRIQTVSSAKESLFKDSNK